MIIVIADDITGAAEIAGVALRQGYAVDFSINSVPTETRADIIVVATDTRSVAPSEAGEVCRRLCRQAMSLTPQPLLFKKVDSVLRGNVGKELSAILDATAFEKILLLPQNPSRGRIISGGIYYVDGVELSKTAFASDPEFPAHTSEAGKLLHGSPSSISIADATTTSEIRSLVEQASAGTLIAGGADTFAAFLLAHGAAQAKATTASHSLSTSTLNSPLLAIQGSTQSHSLTASPLFRRFGGTEITMPDDVFHGSPPRLWLSRLKREWLHSSALAIRIGTHQTMGAGYASRLRQLTAIATTELVAEKTPSTLIFEGGATAFAALSAMDWTSLSVEGEFTPGVVALRHDTTMVVLKPGSYDWN